MLSPILSFTTDEAWEFLPGIEAASPQLTVWQPESFIRHETERAKWKAFFELREAGLAELEKARQAKIIGKALEAKITLAGKTAASWSSPEDVAALRELLNVSQLEIVPSADANTTVTVSKAAGEKCERCWHWETDVGKHAEHPTICGRCVQAVSVAPVTAKV
jgi:isoleucyl-tRNA synthetase